MIALVTGGASSGKSAYAEELALCLPGPHVYAATMRHGDGETERRIDRHVRAREGKGFATVELAVPGARMRPCQGTVLLEDLGNLVANGLDDMLADVLACANAVVVGNEVGCDGVRYDGATMGYIKRLGALSCAIAARADLVVECICGMGLVVKRTDVGRAVESAHLPGGS